MTTSNASTPPSPTSSTTASTTPAQVQPSELTTPINVYDAGAVKQKLDKTIQTVLNNKGYQEDFTISNIKIVCGIIACTSAVVAYFKTDHLVIMTLCAIYFVFGFVSQYTPSLLEKQTVFLSKGPLPVRVETELEVKKVPVPVYSLKVIALKDRMGLIARYRYADTVSTGSLSWPVNELLDESGIVDYERLAKEIVAAVNEAESKRQ